MKTLTIILLLFVTTVLNAQKPIFKGISSGMSESAYLNHVGSHEDFTYYKKSFHEVELSGKIYLTSPSFNSKGQLWGLAFFGYNTYEWFDYKVNVKPILLDLYGLLKLKYGMPDFDEYVDWTEIPDDDFKTICSWKSGSLSISLNVQETDDKYGVFISFIDNIYYESDINDTEGF